MTRRTLAAWALAALCGLAATGPTPTAAVAACGSYGSQTIPPPTVRVFRAATGSVETVDFRAYLKNVLSREWISSWTTESLRAGALAVKHYAWYQVLHWRGYVSAGGECFDLFDTARDQVYDPSRPIYAPMASAVDATWSTLALRNGSVFPTYYNSGAWNEACGANANGWQMFQWGSQACGLDGLSAAQIMSFYYSGLQVTDAPPATTPAPTPTPTPRPSAPPATPVPSGSPGPTVPPTPTPTPQPTLEVTGPATPTELPGGGQVGLAAPPPPPPPDPVPIVVTAATASAAVAPPPTAAEVDIRDMRDHAIVRFERAADEAAAKARWRAPRASPRFIALGVWVGAAIDRLLADLGEMARTTPARGHEVAAHTVRAGLRRD
jgi:hypothetical protein